MTHLAQNAALQSLTLIRRFAAQNPGKSFFQKVLHQRPHLKFNVRGVIEVTFCARVTFRGTFCIRHSCLAHLELLLWLPHVKPVAQFCPLKSDPKLDFFNNF